MLVPGPCGNHPQEPGLGISRRDHPSVHAALRHAAAGHARKRFRGRPQTGEKLTRLCTIPESGTLAGDRSAYDMEARILRPLLWFDQLEYRGEKPPDSASRRGTIIARPGLFDRLLSFDAKL